MLRERGACFATELAAATNRLPDDIERGLWDGVARGLLTSDGFGAIRARVDAGATASADARRLSRLLRGARPRRRGAGRWSLVPATPTPATPTAPTDDELAEAVAELLLHRWGVVFRDLARPRLAAVPVARRAVGAAPARRPRARARRPLRQRVQRRAVRAARRPSSSSPTSRKAPRTGERVVVNATDPLNLVGLDRARRDRCRRCAPTRSLYVDGIPEDTREPVDATLVVSEVA